MRLIERVEAAVEGSLYEVLEVSPNASAAVIKVAYRCLAQKFHPDKNSADPGAVERLSLINQAYAVLADPLLRARYDARCAIRGTDRRGSGRALSPAKKEATSADAQLRPFAFRQFR